MTAVCGVSGTVPVPFVPHRGSGKLTAAVCCVSSTVLVPAVPRQGVGKLTGFGCVSCAAPIPLSHKEEVESRWLSVVFQTLSQFPLSHKEVAKR